MDRFQIGDIVVHRVEEWHGNFTTPDTLFTGYDEASFQRHRDLFANGYYDPDANMIHAFLQSWVLEVNGLTVRYDTGAGNHKTRPGIPIFGDLDTDFLANLRVAGFAPEDIDLVICSHLHIDHVGWNTLLDAGQWIPTFRNARYLFSAVDFDFWNPRNAAKYPEKIGALVNTGVFEDSVAPVFDAGLVELVDQHHSPCAGLTLEAAPGHTPGHLVMKVESRGERAIFVADILHHPAQVFYPDWNSVFCENAQMARRTRRAVLAWAAETGATVVPAHFGGAHVCTVRESGEGFEPVLPPARGNPQSKT